MEQITDFLNNIDFEAIISWITDYLFTIDFQSIIDNIITFVAGLII
ncbi:MAG: hypothetical protein U0K91_06350 [Acutalibacteraceae bacterium]|nr:hypothetical protein [Acutalibacteraceae bacterium]